MVTATEMATEMETADINTNSAKSFKTILLIMNEWTGDCIDRY